MIAETYAYRLLSKDKALNELLNKFRGSLFGNGFNQGIFTYDIPEKPTNLKRKNLAPFMRINARYDNNYQYADDDAIATEQRIVVHFWCATSSQSEEIAKEVDRILKAGGFERYVAGENPRYRDSDIDLLMNVRKYRFFDWKLNKEEEI